MTTAQSKITTIREIEFMIGDYVLIGCPQSTQVSKLMVLSSWPAGAVDSKQPLVAVVEDLLEGKRRDIHVARLKLYQDASLNIDEEHSNDLACQTGHSFMVDEFKDLRKGKRRSKETFEVLTAWVALPG